MKTTVTIKGNFKNARTFLSRLRDKDSKQALEQCGKIMTDALKNNSRVDTGQYAKGWGYNITKGSTSDSLEIYNSSHQDVPDLPFMLEYGHGTGTGGYVPGDGRIQQSINSVKPKCLEIIKKSKE